jgi:large subunit ribosomal protein L3
MAIGLVGRKLGMTRVYDESGTSTPVSVVLVDPNRITQLKTQDTDGYEAIQVTTGERRQSRVTKPLQGHYAKAETPAGRGIWEFRLEQALTDEQKESQFKLGAELKVDVFEEGQTVDVTGTSKGKGFAGGVKRHHFSMQDATHGNSLSHRAHGSTGQNQTPGRVFKGKKMAGQLGNVQRTTQNLKVVRIDAERNLILIKGAIPGAPNGDVIIKPAVKAKGDK